MKKVADFLFEVGHMAKIDRTGFYFLWSGKQNLAEHTNRVCYIGYALGMLDGTVDVNKIVVMCLFHDITEIRSLDANYIAQKYVTIDEHKILDDQIKELPFKEQIKSMVGEYQERESMESIYAKEADILELVLFLKQELDVGNPQAGEWIKDVTPRLKTDLGKKLCDDILATRYDNRRWFDKTDKRWSTRNEKTQ